MQRIFFVILFFWETTICGAQALTTSAHKQQLVPFKERAEVYFNKNLNRFGLEELKQYDKTLDALFAIEKADTLKTLQASGNKSRSLLNVTLSDLKTRKESLLKEKAGFDINYHNLIISILGFVILLASGYIIALWIQFKKYRNKVSESASLQLKLNKIKTLSESGEKLIQQSEKNLVVYDKLHTLLIEVQSAVGQFQETISSDDKKNSWKEVMIQTKKVNQLLAAETDRQETIREFAENNANEKEITDVNKLCQRYFNLVLEGFKSKEDVVGITGTTDLEKNLPKIKIVPSAIGHLLVHILTNAMQSVQSKATRVTKGYEPKVALSTRILPRFLQIRIHDNGDGIEDKYMSKIKEAFFTLKNNDDAGLGLFISDRIMKNHQGELKIESDKTRGTDIYLKFFIP